MPDESIRQLKQKLEQINRRFGDKLETEGWQPIEHSDVQAIQM